MIYINTGDNTCPIKECIRISRTHVIKMPMDPTKLNRKRSSAQQGVLAAVEWCAIIFAGMLALLFLVWAVELQLPDRLPGGIDSNYTLTLGGGH